MCYQLANSSLPLKFQMSLQINRWLSSRMSGPTSNPCIPRPLYKLLYFLGEHIQQYMQAVFISAHTHNSTIISSSTGATDAGRGGVTLQSSHSSKHCVQIRAMYILTFRSQFYFSYCFVLILYITPFAYAHLFFWYVSSCMGGPTHHLNNSKTSCPHMKI